MKTLIAIVTLIAIMVVGVSALAEVSLDQAKQIALERAGVAAEDAVFTKAHKDYDDGQQEYEIEFYVGATEYEMDVDAASGRVTDFDTEIHAVNANGWIVDFDD